jgi:trigger factor
MQVSVESSEGLERRMTVELPAERVDEAVEKRLKEVARTIKLDGFRPGKVPMSVVRSKFKNDVRQEVFGDLVQSTYFEALTQEELVPAGEPSAIEPVEQSNGEGMAYTAVFEVMPEVKLNDLDEVTVTRTLAEVTDADLDEMIEKLRQQRITWNAVEREVQDGDQVTINFKGFIDGEAFEGGSADSVPLEVGSGRMIPGFEEGLIGAKAGENRSLELSFPEDYHAEDLKGKAATFEVDVKEVAESVLPEIDEEFIKAFGISEGGVEAFRDDIRGNMQRELADKIQNLLKEQVMDALVEVNPLEVPTVMVKQEAEGIRQQTKNNMAQYGQPADMDLPLELFMEQAEKRVKLGLIMGEVIRVNEITVDDDRVQVKIEQFSQTYENPQEVIDYYANNQEQLATIQNVVLEDEVVDWVLEQVKVEEVKSGFGDIMNPVEPGAEASDSE